MSFLYLLYKIIKDFTAKKRWTFLELYLLLTKKVCFDHADNLEEFMYQILYNIGLNGAV